MAMPAKASAIHVSCALFCCFTVCFLWCSQERNVEEPAAQPTGAPAGGAAGFTGSGSTNTSDSLQVKYDELQFKYDELVRYTLMLEKTLKQRMELDWPQTHTCLQWAQSFLPALALLLMLALRESPRRCCKRRKWSDEWLAIASAKELDNMVPALEATIDQAKGVARADIAGLEFAKTQIWEALVLPQLRPDLFTSELTPPARGLLLFGPPGTGKTLLGRWIAAECKATFFNIKPASLLSMWVGGTEKAVEALFKLAADRQPSVIFIDEIDSLLSQRRDTDHEVSRRVKAAFLTKLEGVDTDSKSRVLLVGTTNVPWELDGPALDRLPTRLYVPPPGRSARLALLQHKLNKHNEQTGLAAVLNEDDITALADLTVGYSGRRYRELLGEAAMGPVREANAALRSDAANSAWAPRNITMQDFKNALQKVKPSFDVEKAERYGSWNMKHGTVPDADMQDCDETEMDLT